MTILDIPNNRFEHEYELIIAAFLDKYNRVPTESDFKQIEVKYNLDNKYKYSVYYKNKRLGFINILKGTEKIILSFTNN